MLEPIDIDINMNQNVSEEAGKAAAANDEMTKSVDAMQKEIERLNQVVQDMSVALAEQRKITAESGAESAQAAKKVEAMQMAVDKAEAELAVYQSTCEQMNKAVREGADVTEVLTDAEKGLAKTRDDLTGNAKILVDNQNEINKNTDQAEKSTSAYSASNKILSEAVKSVCDSLGIENTQVKNAIGNVRVIDAVKKGWAKTSALLTTELGMTATASKALMFTGIGLLLAGIASLVLLYNKWNDKQKEANRLQQEYRKFQSEATAAVQEQISKVQILEKILSDSNNTYAQRNKALNEIKSILPEYNALLSKEGTLIDDNTGALKRYIQQLKNTALAKGAMDKFVAAQNELTQRKAETINPEHMALYDVSGEKIFSDSRYSADERYIWAYYHGMLEKEEENVKLWATEVEKYTKDNIDAVVENTKTYWEQKQNQAYDALKRLTPEDKKNQTPAWVNAQSAYDTATDKLKTWDIKGQHRADVKAETLAAKETKERDKAATLLEKKAYEYQQRIDNARVKATTDGAEKERQAAKAEYDQTRAFLEKEYKSIADIEKKTGKPADQQRTLLLSLDVEATRQYEAELGRINGQAKTTIDSIFTEVNARFVSELDRNIAEINNYYTEVIKDATKAGATIDEINQLQTAKDKETDTVKRNSELERLDFETNMALRRQELSNNYFVFESDKTKKLLDIQLAAAQKRKKILETQYKATPTTEIADSIEDVKLEIDGLEKSINKLPAKKLSEFVGLFNQLSDSLGSLSGFDVSPMTNMLSGASDIFGKVGDLKDTLKDIKLAGGDTTGALLSGGIGIFGAAASATSGIISTIVNKKEREAEIQRQLVKLQQQYNIDLRQQTYDLISSVDYAQAFRDNMEALHWLIEKGFISNVDYTAWGALNDQLKKAEENLDATRKSADGWTKTGTAALDSLYKDLKGDKRFKTYNAILADWKNGVIGVEEAFKRLEAAGWKGMGDLANNIANADEEAKKWAETIAEIAQQMSEFATGTSFDGFLSDAMTALDNLRKGITDTADFTEDAFTNAILSSFKYQVLSEALKPFYNELSKMFTTDFNGIDKAWADDWKARLKEMLGEKGGLLDSLFESLGIEESSQRQGATGGLSTASQDSINELSGGVYAVRQIVGDIRNDNREELLVQRTIMSLMSVLVERSEYWEYLEELPKVTKKLGDIQDYGLKMN